MTLRSTPSYPASACYVLKLHGDSVPGQGHIAGRLEHLSSGASLVFDDADSLMRALLAHADSVQRGEQA